MVFQQWKDYIQDTFFKLITWSPPNAATQGLKPPVPVAIRAKPSIDVELQN